MKDKTERSPLSRYLQKGCDGLAGAQAKPSHFSFRDSAGAVYKEDQHDDECGGGGGGTALLW
jgi:hypothetical protein